MMKKTYSLLASAVFVSLSSSVLAAEPGGWQEMPEEEPVQTRQVIVTATRTEEEVKNVPNSVEVITAEDIQKLGATNLYQALSLADNVAIMPQNNGFGRRISIRGMASNEALILVNGRRVAVEDTSTAQNLMTLERINVHNVERVEIVRGAASAQYGSDALAGVINIITKTSDGKPSVTVGASTGTESMNNYYHVDVGRHGRFSGVFDVNIGKDRSRMMQEGDMGYLYGPKQNFSFNGTYEFNDRQSLHVDASYFKSDQEADWPSIGPGVQSAIGGMIGGMVTGMGGAMGLSAEQQSALTERLTGKYLYYDPYKAKLETEQRDVSVTFDGKTDKNDYMVRAYYSHMKKSRLLPYEIFGSMENIGTQVAYDILHEAGFSSAEGTAPTYGDTNKYTVFGIEAKDSMAIGDHHVLTFGGDWTQNKIEGSNIGSDSGSKDTKTFAAYVQDEWMIGDKVLLIPAVRYDHHSDFGSETTPKIGATWFINPNSRFKVNWGRGFKAPTVTELYSDFYHAGSTVLGNPDLVPEESTNFDISYELEGHGNFGKLTYFNNHVENYITTHDLGGSLSRYYNIEGTTKTHGFELTLGRNFNKHWMAKINSNWTSASNVTGSTGGHGVDGFAENITTVQIGYDDLKPYGYTVTLWDQWAYDYSDGTDEYTYNTLNVVVNKKFGDGCRIFAGLDNILDKKISAINLDGRLWRVGAEWTF